MSGELRERVREAVEGALCTAGEGKISNSRECAGWEHEDYCPARKTDAVLAALGPILDEVEAKLDGADALRAAVWSLLQKGGDGLKYRSGASLVDALCACDRAAASAPGRSAEQGEAG